jgi:hypothetical protein
VVHVSADRVYDVDLTVEQGIRSIVTSGVATGESGDDGEELVDFDLQAIRQQATDNVDDFARQARRDFASVHPERDPEDVDDRSEDSPTHYMIDDSAKEDFTDDSGTDGEAPEPASSDEPADENREP